MQRRRVPRFAERAMGCHVTFWNADQQRAMKKFHERSLKTKKKVLQS
jgi:hypothetical protein